MLCCENKESWMHNRIEDDMTCSNMDRHVDTMKRQLICGSIAKDESGRC